MIAADEAADVAGKMHIGARRDSKAEVARLEVERLAHRRHERRPSQLPYRQAEQEMMHRRVAADGDIDNFLRRRADGMAEIVRQRVDGGHRAFAQLMRGLRAADGVIHAADDIGAPEDLRVLDAEAGQALPARQIEQEAGDVGGAEIDRQAQRAAAGRGEVDRFRPAQAHAQRPIIVAQDRWQLPGGGEVDRGKG